MPATLFRETRLLTHDKKAAHILPAHRQWINRLD
jgi:hypothetical protein